MENPKLTINELVRQNRYIAWSLHYFGFHFQKISRLSLEQLCNENGISVTQVIQQANRLRTEIDVYSLELVNYPIDLVVEYLKHTHYLFVKRKLPFLRKYIFELDLASSSPYGEIVRDLKFVFPLFEQDFIEHIYQEEDELFDYVLQMNKVISGKSNLSKIYHMVEDSCLQHHALHHAQDDDEMKGIRELTREYKLSDSAEDSIHFLYKELQHFEHQLNIHAKIENDILFPRAISLEKRIRFLMFQSARQN